MLACEPITTCFDAVKAIRPFYSGGPIDISRGNYVLATTLNEDVILSNLQSTSFIGRIPGDGEIVTALALTPLADRVIVCSRSFSMRIFCISLDSSQHRVELERSIKAHNAPVVAAITDDDGKFLATGGADGILKIWDIRGGFVTHTFHGHGTLITSLCFFTYEQDLSNSIRRKKGQLPSLLETTRLMLASGGEDGKIIIYDIYAKTVESTLKSHVSIVRCLAYSCEQNVLISASRDGTLVIWEDKSWKIRHTIPCMESVESCGFLKNNLVAYTGGEKGVLRLWSTRSGGEISTNQVLGNGTDGIISVLTSLKLEYIVSVHADQALKFHRVKVKETSTGKKEVVDKVVRGIMGTYEEIFDISLVGRDWSYLALATNTGDVKIIRTGQIEGNGNMDIPDELAPSYETEVGNLNGHSDVVIALDVDASGNWLATGSKDGKAKLWYIEPDKGIFECYCTFTGHTESIGGIALPRHHSKNEQNEARIRDEPEWLITGSQDLTIKVWSVPSSLREMKKGESRTGKAMYTRKAHSKEINALDSMMQGNKTIFGSASQDRLVKIWDLKSGEALGELKGHIRGVWTIRFCPFSEHINIPQVNKRNGSVKKGLVITGSGDKSVKLWSLSDYTCISTFEGHSNSVLRVIWIPFGGINQVKNKNDEDNYKEPRLRKDGSLLIASCGADGLVKIWDIVDETCACTLDGHQDRVWGLASRRVKVNGAKQVAETAEASLEDFKSQDSQEDDQTILISAGADSVINFWVDKSRQRHEDAVRERAKLVEDEQKLTNLVLSGQTREAFGMAIAMNRPQSLQKILREMHLTLNDLCGDVLNNLVKDLSSSQLYMVLLWIRDWNASPKFTEIAQVLLSSILRSIPAPRLAALYSLVESDHDPVGNDAIVALFHTRNDCRNVFSAISAYTQRNLQRLTKLEQDTYLIDFILGDRD